MKAFAFHYPFLFGLKVSLLAILGQIVTEFVLFGLMAVYGYWLLHRAEHRFTPDRNR